MGMYDTVRCDYPLSHHQDAEYQTKDLAFLVYGSDLRGMLHQYRITADGRLERGVRGRVWRENVKAPLGGTLELPSTGWETIPDVHGDLRMYTSETSIPDGGRRRIEFRVRFTNGRVQDVRELGGSEGGDSERPVHHVARVGKLSQTEIEALRSFGVFGPARRRQQDPKVEKALDFDGVVRSALSIREAARRLETDEARIWTLLANQKLFGFQFDQR